MCHAPFFLSDSCSLSTTSCTTSRHVTPQSSTCTSTLYLEVVPVTTTIETTPCSILILAHTHSLDCHPPQTHPRRPVGVQYSWRARQISPTGPTHCNVRAAQEVTRLPIDNGHTCTSDVHQCHRTGF